MVYKEFYETLLEGIKAESAEELDQERIINERYCQIAEKAKYQKPIKITMTVVKNTIKCLKKGKAGDEYGWRNEILLYGGEIVQEGIMMMFNEVNEKERIPKQWETVLRILKVVRNKLTRTILGKSVITLIYKLLHFLND